MLPPGTVRPAALLGLLGLLGPVAVRLARRSHATERLAWETPQTVTTRSAGVEATERFLAPPGRRER